MAVDLTKELAKADQALALKTPYLHPAPGKHQHQQRLKMAEARKAAAAVPKAPNLAKQLQMLRRREDKKPPPPKDVRVDGEFVGPTAPPPPVSAFRSPEERQQQQVVRDEIQQDMVTALVRGARLLAGRWVDPEKADRIQQSPAVGELVRRVTGFIDRSPNLAQLGVVVAAKLL